MGNDYYCYDYDRYFRDKQRFCGEVTKSDAIAKAQAESLRNARWTQAERDLVLEAELLKRGFRITRV